MLRVRLILRPPARLPAPGSSSSSESRQVDDDDGLTLRLRYSFQEVDDPVRLKSVLFNRSKEDICFSSELRCSRPETSGVVRPDDVTGGGRLRCLVSECLEPTRLKFRIRARALLLDVSERALRAGEGGVKSGRVKSCTGTFQ